MPGPSLYELCCLSAWIYGDVADLEAEAENLHWRQLDRYDGASGFRAGVFRKDQATVIAFRGTTGAIGDWTADAMLGVGMNTSHFSQGDEYFAKWTLHGPVTLCGHSLGGAIAQVVGNRGRVPFATFNAPGVAVLASRNIATANLTALKIRAVGAVASTLMDPNQAWKDVCSAFYLAAGVNICLIGDPVSHVGVHYGRVVRLLGVGHGVATVAHVFKDTQTGQTSIDSYV
jgi:hypothetical protein